MKPFAENKLTLLLSKHTIQNRNEWRFRLGCKIRWRKWHFELSGDFGIFNFLRILVEISEGFWRRKTYGHFWQRKWDLPVSLSLRTVFESFIFAATFKYGKANSVKRISNHKPQSTGWYIFLKIWIIFMIFINEKPLLDLIFQNRSKLPKMSLK